MIRLLSFSVSLIVTMTLVATLVARVVSYGSGTEQPSTLLIERGHHETLVQRVSGGIEADGSRASARQRAAQAHLR